MATALRANRGLWLGLLVVVLAVVCFGVARVPDARAWEPTVTFEVPVPGGDGRPFACTMRGYEGRFGFIKASGFRS